uniref:Uncharacterized protein n=1 Tax=Rhizophora mucronata TaxID=61149 RepID=A0A2P2QAK6_RHIMU
MINKRIYGYPLLKTNKKQEQANWN